MNKCMNSCAAPLASSGKVFNVGLFSFSDDEHVAQRLLYPGAWASDFSTL